MQSKPLDQYQKLLQSAAPDASPAQQAKQSQTSDSRNQLVATPFASRSALKPSSSVLAHKNPTLHQLAVAFDQKIRGVNTSNQKSGDNFIRANREKAYSQQQVKYNASKVAEKFIQECNSNQRSPIPDGPQGYDNNLILEGEMFQA